MAVPISLEVNGKRDAGGGPIYDKQNSFKSIHGSLPLALSQIRVGLFDPLGVFACRRAQELLPKERRLNDGFIYQTQLQHSHADGEETLLVLIQPTSIQDSAPPIAEAISTAAAAPMSDFFLSMNCLISIPANPTRVLVVVSWLPWAHNDRPFEQFTACVIWDHPPASGLAFPRSMTPGRTSKPCWVR